MALKDTMLFLVELTIKVIADAIDDVNVVLFVVIIILLVVIIILLAILVRLVGFFAQKAKRRRKLQDDPEAKPPGTARTGYSKLLWRLLGMVFVLLVGVAVWWQAKEAILVVEEEARLAGEMVTIPGGTFLMGDLSGKGDDDERPVHKVTVVSFELGKYEVTFSQWEACVADGGCLHLPDDAGWGRDNRPVINVSWDDIQQFIVWLNAKTDGGYRLPTESEWEYAARAGRVTEYSWGDNIREDGGIWANCVDCGSEWDGDRTASVGRFLSNAWGLHDMHGNVWEWVEDCWNDSYGGAPVDGSAWELLRRTGLFGKPAYGGAPVDGSAWESGDCSQRVIRGGSWGESSWNLRSAHRNGGNRSFRFDGLLGLGFRLAKDK